MTDPEIAPDPDPHPAEPAPPAVMTASAAAEPPLPPPPPSAAEPVKVKKSGSPIWPILGVIGFLVLAAGELYLWRLDQMTNQAVVAAQNAGAGPFASAPAGAPGPAETTPGATASGTSPSGGPAAPPVTAASVTAQIASLQNEIVALQQTTAKAAPAPDSIATQADQSEKLAVLSAEISALQTSFAADHSTLTTVAADDSGLQKLTSKITLLTQLAGARMALDSGQPLGNIPGAPAALAAYATTPPPTLAQLELTFPQAAAAADSASVDKATKNSFWARVTARLESLVTISNGSHVMMGAPAAAITAQAQTQLNAGDLAGAVTTLTQNLSDTTLAAMGPWLAQAKSLLAARAAIIQMSQS
jgi:hypothetical protein